MFEFPRTLATRLTLLYAAIFAVLSSTAFFVAYVWIEARLDARIEADLREDLIEFQTLLSIEGLEGVKSDILREIGADAAGQVLLRVTDGSGRPVIDSPSPVRTGTTWEHSTYAAIIAGAEPRLKTVVAGEDGDDMKVLLGQLGPGLVIEIGESLEEKEDVLELLLGAFTAILVVGIAVAAAVGWIMSRAALQGIEEVTRAAGDVAAGNFDRRVSVSNRSEEVGRLAGTFNVMVDRIRALILEMRVMTDNIAHDLRSPLTRLRASVEEAVLRARSIDEFRAASEETL